MIGYGTPASRPCHRWTSVPQTSDNAVRSSAPPAGRSGSANSLMSIGTFGAVITAASTVRGIRYGILRQLTRLTTPHTIADAAAKLRDGSISARELVDAALDAINLSNGRINAFIRVDAEGARAAATRMDDERRRGIDRGPLQGIPISLKDLIEVAGQATTAASRVFADRIPAEDAPVVARLRDAGAVIIGKTNLHEFALGTTSEESAFGAVHNPRDLTRSAGGSSRGTAPAR